MPTVLISALTAAVVTLLIEYFAKPYLEVRRDRIVEIRRKHRELKERLLSFIQQMPDLALIHPHSEFFDRAEVDKRLSEAKEIVNGYPKYFGGDRSRIRRRTVLDHMSRLRALAIILDNLVAYMEEVPSPDLPDELHMADQFKKVVKEIDDIAAVIVRVLNTSHVGLTMLRIKVMFRRNPQPSQLPPPEDREQEDDGGSS